MYDRMILISGDSDQIPAIEFDKGNTSRLSRSVHAQRQNPFSFLDGHAIRDAADPPQSSIRAFCPRRTSRLATCPMSIQIVHLSLEEHRSSANRLAAAHFSEANAKSPGFMPTPE
jgi:hypothetical protein